MMAGGQPFPRREVSFTIPGEPATKARARVTIRGGKPRAYTPEPTKRAEAAMRAGFLASVGREAPSSTHGFGVEADFFMASGIRRDVDNMLKIVLDGLNKVAWGDDYQVVEVVGRKSAVPKGQERTEVRIYVLGELISRRAVCEHCGDAFPRPPSHGKKKYCSGECRSAALAAARTRACEECGTSFKIHNANQPTHGRFCSTACKAASSHVEATCVRCAKKFTKPRHLNRSGNSYCSPECKATYWREQRKGAAKGTCSDCGGPTSKKSYVRCRDC